MLSERVNSSFIEPGSGKMRDQLQVVLAPSGLVEQLERDELERVVDAGDAAFGEIERG